MERTTKLFSLRAISIATYFGGPAAAGYLLKKNFESNNQPITGKKAFISGIISTILIFAGIFSLPEAFIDKIPNVLFPASYTAIIYVIAEKTQGNWIKEHKETGGEFYSAWKAAGIGAIFLVFLFSTIMGIAFIAGDLIQPDFDEVRYNKEVAKFVENENNSLKVFGVINTAEPQYLIGEFSAGIGLWKENKKIISGINTLEHLPIELHEVNKKLWRYCDLRIQHNTLIVKALKEDTDEYVLEIGRIGLEIDKILEGLH